MSDTEIAGTVVHIRKVSRKLVFFDVIVVDEEGGEHRHTVVLKSWIGPDLVDRANRGPDKLHVGDLVRVIGCREKETECGSGGDFAATDFSVTERWSARHQKESFCPIPPKLATRSDNNIHLSSAVDIDNVSEQLCKFFLNSGRCAAAESCRFRHSQKGAAIVRDRLAYVGAKFAARQQRHETEFPPDTPVCSAAKRAEVFGRWIVEKFGGADRLRSGIILDVAGGRGDLAFELAVKLGLPCWTVDPRPQKFRRWQMKMLRSGDPGITPPCHKQEYFDRDFFAKCGLDPGRVRLVVGMYGGLLAHLPVT
jgi:hypothetical protein